MRVAGVVGVSIERQLGRRPYATLAAAAGVGYVLGGGLATPLTRIAIGAMMRLAVALAVREVSLSGRK